MNDNEIALNETIAELLELLAEALEQLEDPFMYAPVEHNRLEEKIRDVLEKESAT